MAKEPSSVVLYKQRDDGTVFFEAIMGQTRCPIPGGHTLTQRSISGGFHTLGQITEREEWALLDEHLIFLRTRTKREARKE